MWKRRILKKNMRASLKSNYWCMIAVCFLSAVLTTAYTSSTSFLSLYNPQRTAYEAESNFSEGGQSNAMLLSNAVGRVTDRSRSRLFSYEPLNTAADIFIGLYTNGKSLFFSVLRAADSILDNHSQWISFFLSAGVVTGLLYYIFIANIILIGESRFFLETRMYRKTSLTRLFYLYKLRYIRNPAWIMFCRGLYQWLWNLTIVGGLIKHYEYSMIPFILAENPAISRKDVFLLSKRLMKGNKWRMFLLHFSFAGWQLLTLFTLGILGFLYVNPYVTGTDAELYMELRNHYIRCRMAGYEKLNDSLLSLVPSQDELLISKALYDDSEGPYMKISYFAPEQYPMFMFSIQPPMGTVKMPVRADKHYGFLPGMFLFFCFSFLAWILEGVVHLVRNGDSLNLGFLFGPWLPMYSLCALVLLIFIKRFIHNPILTFMMTGAAYTVIKYAVFVLLNDVWHIAPSVNTVYFLNMDGNAFLGGAVFFALTGCAFLYYMAPRWDSLFCKLPCYVQIGLCTLLWGLFIADLLYTGSHLDLYSEVSRLLPSP